jgi:hypothetical protein
VGVFGFSHIMKLFFDESENSCTFAPKLTKESYEKEL